MKKFLTTVIALCLCLAISVLAVGCGEQNAYKKFVKKWGGHSADIKVESGSISKEHVSDRYSLTGKYQGYSSGSFAVTMNEVTVSTNDTPQTDDDTSVTIEFSIHYSQSTDKIKVYAPKYLSYKGSTSLDKANHSGFMYEFKNGIQYGSVVAGAESDVDRDNAYVFDANKYFDDNKLTVEDAEKLAEYSADELYGILNTNKDAWISENPTWKEDMIADILDAINATLAEVDKMIEAKMGE